MSSAIATPVPSQDRLERFRAARAKLDPAGDPADAMARFYIDTPRSVSSRIAAELEIAPASSHLLVGGVGSGKTTELLATARHVASIADIATLYVDVTRQHDIAKMMPGAIIAQVGLGLADQLQQLGPSPHIQTARDVAYGSYSWESRYEEDYFEDPGDYVPGVLLPPEQVSASVLRARGPLEGLLHTVRLRKRHVVVMLDGLDRIADLQAFEQLIDHDVKTLTSLGIGVVLVGPLRALYGLDRVLVQRFDSFHYQPWIDVSRDRAGHDFLTGVLTTRAAEAFDRPAIEPLIAGSGGVLRDLLSLAQSALVEAYMDGCGRRRLPRGRRRDRELRTQASTGPAAGRDRGTAAGSHGWHLRADVGGRSRVADDPARPRVSNQEPAAVRGAPDDRRPAARARRMTGVVGVGGMAAGELALRLSALRGTATYAAYLAEAPDLEAMLGELEDELRALTSDAAVVRFAPRNSEQLIIDLATTSIEIVLVDARTFSAHEWAQIDRRRSAIAHRGVLVFVTTPASFDDLMRNAPNLSSWLGGEVFAYPNSEAIVAGSRERRLAALRTWASKADEEIVEAARAGTLSRDPE